MPEGRATLPYGGGPETVDVELNHEVTLDDDGNAVPVDPARTEKMDCAIRAAVIAARDALRAELDDV